MGVAYISRVMHMLRTSYIFRGRFDLLCNYFHFVFTGCAEPSPLVEVPVCFLASLCRAIDNIFGDQVLSSWLRQVIAYVFGLGFLISSDLVSYHSTAWSPK